MNKTYKRVVLKISGEQLAGAHGSGLDPEVATYLADEVKKVTAAGCQIIVMVGGGNLIRGATTAGDGIQRVTADHMGMLATMINALALTDIFEAQGLATRCLSNIFAQQVAEPFVHRLANKHLEKGRVVILAGGSGRPYVTTDTAAVILALELDCEAVFKATKVDGVYDKDPIKHADAVRLETVSHQHAVENAAIKVMDKAAMGLAMEQKMPIVVFNAMQPGNLLKLVGGDTVGTKVS